MSKALYDALKAAELATLQFGLEQAIVMSSGPISLSWMRRNDHPYSQRNPHPPLKPSIINSQSGQFRAGWEIEMFYVTGEGVTGRLVNESRHADFIEAGGSGRSKMIERPIARILEKRMEPVRLANLELALLKAIPEELNES